MVLSLLLMFRTLLQWRYIVLIGLTMTANLWKDKEEVDWIIHLKISARSLNYLVLKPISSCSQEYEVAGSSTTWFHFHLF